jgi:hypothetical protein
MNTGFGLKNGGAAPGDFPDFFDARGARISA